MSYSRTVGQLTASIRNRGDYQEVDASDDYISGPFLIEAVAAAYKEAYELLADADADRLTTVSTTTLSTTTGSFDLPTDLYRLREIAVARGELWYPLLRDDPSALHGPWELPSAYSMGLPAHHYHLQGDRAFISPMPPAGTSFRVTYIPSPATLSAPDDIVSGIGGADELVVWTALRDCRTRAEQSTTECDAKIGQQTQRIKDQARDRDSGQAKRVEDPIGGWLGRRGRRRSR